MCGKPHRKNIHFKINPDMCKIVQNTYVRIHFKPRVRQLRKEIIDNITSILKGIPEHRAEFRRWDPEQQDEEILYDVLAGSREEGCYPTVMNVQLAPNDMVVVALSIQSGDFELPATDSDLSTDDLANINDVLIEMSINYKP